MIESEEDLLRTDLQHAAAGHEPDRTAMLNRIAANRARRAPRTRALRLAGSALAVTATLGGGGMASWALAGESHRGPVPPVADRPSSSAILGATADAPATSPSRTPESRPRSSAPAAPAASAPASPSESRPAVRGHPGDTQVTKGSLVSVGTLDAGGGRSTVTLRPSVDLTELDLTIRVLDDGAPGPASSTLDGVSATVERSGAALLFHFVLRPGATVRAGEYRFTAGYPVPAAGRDPAEDTYEAFASDVNHKRIHVYGNFVAKADGPLGRTGAGRRT